MRYLNFPKVLSLLDRCKIATNNLLFMSALPIPSAIWNGAIDVLKNILRATNSTQKAIRVAAKYIVDRGGTEAQAKDFQATMTVKLASTNAAKKHKLADSDESMSQEALIKSATVLQGKIKTDDLSQDKKAFAVMDLSTLTKKELNRYVEVAAILAVDPQGVLTVDVNDLLDKIENNLIRQPTVAEVGVIKIDDHGQGCLLDDEEHSTDLNKANDIHHESLADLKLKDDNTAQSNVQKKHIKEMSLQIYVNFERFFLRMVLIGVLTSMLFGYKVYDYYSIAKFAMIFGLALLFWLECKARFYWTMLITAFGICLFNPIDTLHFNKATWLIFDKWLIWFLIGSIFIEVLLLVVNIRKANSKL